MGHLYELIAEQTSQDILYLKEHGFDGSIASLPGIGVWQPSSEVWVPHGDEILNLQFAGSPYSSKSTLLRILAHLYPHEMVCVPSFMDNYDRYVRHAYTYACMCDEFEPQHLNEAFEAELFFQAIRLVKGIECDPMIQHKNQDHQGVRRSLEQVAKIATLASPKQIAEAIDELKRNFGITDAMSDFEKINSFLNGLGVSTEKDFIDISYMDQVHLLVLMRNLFPEIDFDDIIDTFDEVYCEKEDPIYNVKIHAVILREVGQREFYYYARVRNGKAPLISIEDEGGFNALLYYFANVTARRLDVKDMIIRTFNGEQNYWRSLSYSPKGFIAYNAVMFFFTHPDDTLRRAGDYRGFIINPEYLDLLYEQQLAMYSRLLQAGNLPFTFTAIDASGTESHTLRNFRRSFNEIMELGGKNHRL